jgi:hypothetical protein
MIDMLEKGLGEVSGRKVTVLGVAFKRVPMTSEKAFTAVIQSLSAKARE